MIILFVRSTFPPLNIALYNALNGSGDELYGVEPISYYVKNLLLMVGLIGTPLAAVVPAALMCRLMIGEGKFQVEGKLWTICISAFMWVLLLFSRPHKVS